MTQRKNFGKIKEVREIPDLLSIQLNSYDQFLQKDIPADKRKDQGLQAVFREVFPIESFDKQLKIDFVKYEIGEPKKSPVECVKNGETYAAPLHLTFTLETNGEKISETIYMGDFPMMTEHGTFVINGAERVVISQLHRSPGICFEKVAHTSGKDIYSYRIIPDRGSWIEIQFDINDYIYIFFDRRQRKRKFLITTFLKALGYNSNKEILSQLYEIKTFSISELLKKDDIENYYVIEDIISPAGIILIDELSELKALSLKAVSEAGINKLEVVYIPDGADYLIKCMRRDPATDTEEALKEIYRRIRPTDPPSIQNAKQMLKRRFMDLKHYDLGTVGRIKINEKLNLNIPLTERSLVKEDLLFATKYLMDLRHKSGHPDDIDHLGNRRVKTVGELVQNQCRAGLLRTERLIREKMIEDATLTPNKLINPKAFIGVIRDFFARSQLSQFMDQTNPLAEMTNKRRLTALGPGGLTRERAGFEVRDVHYSHYGRVCPIETPEGPNIGLIISMALYAKINELGFLETPYRIVENGVVTNKIEYLTADKESQFIIAQANAPIDETGRFLNPTVVVRHNGDSKEVPAKEVQYMDVSPKQLVSAAAGLIPFLEHDDANRALMGSNMQRQAVPLLTTESPLVGTGLEKKVAVDSRAVVLAKDNGIVAEVSSDKIVITKDGKPLTKTSDKKTAHIYKLNKFLRTNAGTCINQRPIVRSGDKVKKGDIIADGAATCNGELALGKNVTVAFMPWCGYNFEDAIIISERLVKEDVFTSIHIDEFETIARDTKLGAEEITADIPKSKEEVLRNLDSRGIVRLGAELKPDDVIVGKITPKSETELAPEERLLRAIFGEKAADVKDSSLKVSSGKGGIVMDIIVEYAKNAPRQSVSSHELKKQIKQAKDNYKNQYNELINEMAEAFAEFMLDQKLPVPIFDKNLNKRFISANRKIKPNQLKKLAGKYDSIEMEDCPIKEKIMEVVNLYAPKFKEIEEQRDKTIEEINSGDSNMPGAIKRVKVYIASKHKLEVGDKMAGRHGNKGIVAKIVPVEDMPFMQDGTPIDIILNPLGVPSRMNVGQVLETHLGWAAKILGMKIATPVFDGISEEKIVEIMKQANEKIKEETGKDYGVGFIKKNGKEIFDGKVDLYDGRTGDKFDQRVTVGQIYMMKLDHLVSHKIHARSVGPYSLVSQQPLGGKAQNGGQRFGEMEVWALEAYGVAATLQEMLTVKSDDVLGRTKIYESIVKGRNVLECGRPESFNVLLKELQSLALDIRTVKKSELRREE